MCELVIANPIRLWANVPERYRGVVKLGEPVRLGAQSRPDETFEGRVQRINPAVDTTSRAFSVEAIIPNAEGFLRPGGFARGEIITARSAEAVVVPIESVYSFAGVTKIFLVEDGRARGYAVRPGRQYERGIEVIPTDTPLPAEGLVVATGQSVLAKLAEGTPVIIREPDSGGARPTTAEESPNPASGSDAPAAKSTASTPDPAPAR